MNVRMKQSGEQQDVTGAATKSTKQTASSGTFEASQLLYFSYLVKLNIHSSAWNLLDTDKTAKYFIYSILLK